MRFLAGAVSLLLALLALLAPALWNGYPISFHDTGGFIARLFENEPGFGRATPYGLFLDGLYWHLSFWPAIVVQSLIVIGLVAETGRSLLALRGNRLALLTGAGTLLLAAITGISWYTSQLLPDLAAATAVLALFLLIEGREGRSLVVTILLGLVVILGAASHTGTVALLLGLVLYKALLIAGARLHAPLRHWSRRTTWRLGAGGLALALGVLTVPLSNQALYGQFRFTPGGDIFLFGRLVQDGIASRFLADRCPDPAFKLCDYQAELYEPDGSQRNNDSFLWWGGSPLYKIGGWEGAGPELAQITRESLVAYPGLHLAAAWRAFVEQLGLIATGDGLNETHWHTQWILEQYLPQEVPDFLAARQRQKDFPFEALNLVHIPVGFAAFAALPFLAFVSFRRGRAGAGRFTAFVFVALIGNAFICGVLSNPHDRYENRLIWLALLGCIVACLSLWRGRKLTNNQLD
ncbi:hypothetical protein [Zavarzinia aquatilis]|uniref:Glycosyltransferase RgtA/B/C/D-like domain-containing protein n=1 Tax=Zavarzinia aquatilis TaxID=2211142 RepID=A0A317EGM3_9PROT|nr:hypothetical protein [Zavarzinia aquatilis]PWR25911.1 hypothetical protein DKG74_02880 [Zavarzinia aquatilis]